MNNNKYILFGGDEFYACGGGYDFIMASNSKEDILSFLKCNKENYDFNIANNNLIKEGKCPEKNYINIAWWHIFNIVTNKIVKRSKYIAYDPTYNKDKLEIQIEEEDYTI
jgi:hypothetical protein